MTKRKGKDDERDINRESWNKPDIFTWPFIRHHPEREPSRGGGTARSCGNWVWVQVRFERLWADGNRSLSLSICLSNALIFYCFKLYVFLSFHPLPSSFSSFSFASLSLYLSVSSVSHSFFLTSLARRLWSRSCKCLHCSSRRSCVLLSLVFFRGIVCQSAQIEEYLSETRAEEKGSAPFLSITQLFPFPSSLPRPSSLF